MKEVEDPDRPFAPPGSGQVSLRGTDGGRGSTRANRPTQNSFSRKNRARRGSSIALLGRSRAHTYISDDPPEGLARSASWLWV